MNDRWATCTECGGPGALCQGVWHGQLVVVQAERCRAHFARLVGGLDSFGRRWRCGPNGLWAIVDRPAPTDKAIQRTQRMRAALAASRSGAS